MDKQAIVWFKYAIGKIIWLGFTILFFYAGLFFTEWALGAEYFTGGWRWVMVTVFPFLIPGFFIVNRRYGCASGSCKVTGKSSQDSAPRVPLA